MSSEIQNVLTFDIEEYFQVSNFAAVVERKNWDKFESRLFIGLNKILDILGKEKITATFFVLGWIAERQRNIIKKIDELGHEIACHGYDHRLIYNQTPDEFRTDIKKSKMILEDIIQKPVLGYRAPSFSITNKSLWALDILMEEGFEYDSSIYPIYHDKGGIPNAIRFPYKVKKNGKEIVEFPLSTIKIFGYNIPVAGGGYFRFFPYWLIRSGIRSINSKGHPAVVYLHPWELDCNQPKIVNRGLKKLRHYINLDKTETKLKYLLRDFKFRPIKNITIAN